MRDPATQPCQRRTVPSMTPASRPQLAPEPTISVTAVVVIECARRPGQEFPDVHVAAWRGTRHVAAVHAACEAATRRAHDHSPGRPFRVKATTFQ